MFFTTDFCFQCRDTLFKFWRLESVVNFCYHVSLLLPTLIENDKVYNTTLFFSCFYLSGSLLAAESPEVLLRIGGKDFTKQEFEYYCKYYVAGNCRTESVQNVFDDFLFQKLKSADMRRTGCDTLPTFRQYCKVMQGELLKNVMLDKEQEEHICQDLYRQSVERLSKNGWVKIEQITIRLAQNATKQEEYAARNRMDSIYTALKEGAAFSTYSHQVDGGIWVPVVELLQEFTDQIASFSKGDFRNHFFSIGYSYRKAD